MEIGHQGIRTLVYEHVLAKLFAYYEGYGGDEAGGDEAGVIKDGLLLPAVDHYGKDVGCSS